MDARPFKLLALIPNKVDSTSFYRGAGPLAQIRKLNPNISVEYELTFDWSRLQSADALFMQRPFRENHLEIMEMAKFNNLPVWIDYDDDLFTVPESNPTYPVYGTDRIRKNVATMIAGADAVSVSTQHLMDRLRLPSGQLMNKNTMVIPNAFNDYVLKRPKIAKRHPIVFWRGSNTHDEDLMAYADEMVEAQSTSSRWIWHMQGGAPWWLKARMKGSNVIYGEAVDPMEYFCVILARTNPAISIVPLADNTFNRSKSNIAWMEGVFAGACSLVPDWDGWRVPGAITYKDRSEFRQKLRMMMSEPEALTSRSDESWQYIMDELRLSKINSRRLELLERLRSS